MSEGSFRADASVVWRVAIRQLLGRRLLTLVATGGVALGVLTLVVAGALLWGGKRQFEDTVLGISPEIVVRDLEVTDDRPLLERGAVALAAASVAHSSPPVRDARIAFPRDLVRDIEALPGVIAAAPGLAETALCTFGGRTRSLDVRGIELEAEERIRPLSPLVIDGSMSELGAVAHGLCIGRGLAEDLGARRGDVLHLLGATSVPLDFEIVAIFDSRVSAIDHGRAYVTLRDAQLLAGRPDVVGRVHVRLADPDDAPRAARLIERAFGYRAETWQEANANFLGLLAVQRTVGTIILASIVVLGSFGILAVQIMLVLQKQRDIAILRAVGFRSRDVLWAFLLQGAMMAAVGGAVGALVGKLAVLLLATVRIKAEGVVRADHIIVADPPSLYLASLSFTVAMGLLASVLPALRAARVEPVDVLRGQIG